VKPFDVKKVLKTIDEQLNRQEAEKKYSQDRVADFIQARVRELDIENEIAQKGK